MKILLECIDGLPIIIPYGTNDIMLKNISRLSEGWFSGVTFWSEYKVPIYKLKVEPEDRPEVIPIEGANFYYGFYKEGNKILFPKFIVDPDIVFGECKDFSIPVKFLATQKFQVESELFASNKTPCGMGFFKINLCSNDEIVYYSIVGNVQRSYITFLKNVMKILFIKRKLKINN